MFSFKKSYLRNFSNQFRLTRCILELYYLDSEQLRCRSDCVDILADLQGKSRVCLFFDDEANITSVTINESVVNATILKKYK